MSVDGSYQLLPPLSHDEFERLRADIADRGVLVPVEVDEEGTVLDGHHRQRIARELGIPCPKVVRSGLAAHEKRLHAVALNLNRRHLTDAQKVLLGKQIEPDIAERARRRQVEMGRELGAARGGSPDPLGSNVPKGSQDESARTRSEVAETVGISQGRTYERNAKVLDRAAEIVPQVVEKARNGEVTMREVAREVRAAEKASRVAEIASAPVAELPTEQTFPVILADPPWRYEGAETPDMRQIENNYPTMTLDDIKALRVPAADDAVLFLWATAPKLQEAFEVVTAWGFDYRTCAVWVKDKIGMGYYVRGQHELILIARRGSLPVPDPANRPGSVFTAARTAHSAKPVEVYEAIERMYPGYRYCEMFARTRRDGWTGWGNQAGAA